MPFKIGDSVKVKARVMCPDDDSVCVAGWQGRIFEIDISLPMSRRGWDRSRSGSSHADGNRTELCSGNFNLSPQSHMVVFDDDYPK